MTAQEARELDRRDAVGAWFGANRSVFEAAGTFAGSWQDSRTGVLNVSFVGAVPVAVQQLLTLVPAGGVVETHTATRTLARLKALQARVAGQRAALAALGASVCSLYVDEQQNRLVVDIAGAVPESLREVLDQQVGVDATSVLWKGAARPSDDRNRGLPAGRAEGSV